ncbi:hypothetical protein PPYR_02112 [Photinus pyralis]|uniref:Uncharacterized protein n=1 Tax=Photinus pyralis TaxID=7054 RepID=A0A5N4B6B2_PHOPY|nr:hypothetical protein PPYR_02112 [Photinus pyralis]
MEEASTEEAEAADTISFQIVRGEVAVKSQEVEAPVGELAVEQIPVMTAAEPLPAEDIATTEEDTSSENVEKSETLSRRQIIRPAYLNDYVNELTLNVS